MTEQIIKSKDQLIQEIQDLLKNQSMLNSERQFKLDMLREQLKTLEAWEKDSEDE